MDYKDINNKPHLLSKIDELTQDINTLLKSKVEEDICSYKKSALIYYWLRDYKNYLKNEQNFNSKYLPEFERGSIVNVNFGFNIGSEFGGLHYAVVLAHSSKTNPNLIVLPLKSLKNDEKKLHSSELFLGTELYNRLYGKQLALKISINEEMVNLSKRQDAAEKQYALIETIQKDNKEENDNLDKLHEQLKSEVSFISKELDFQEKRISLLESIWNELSKMKMGSIALVSQIKTISKMRVKNPTSMNDVLYGIKLPTSNMTAIDEKIIEIYTNKH
ncbi:hypothetical protein [Phascolarctobacterium sp.]|uniref:hypothetical protein n=1 Tax=Phascolarctobacterium sp. TaxID=2049039 RepID=UPI0030787E8C